MHILALIHRPHVHLQPLGMGGADKARRDDVQYARIFRDLESRDGRVVETAQSKQAEEVEDLCLFWIGGGGSLLGLELGSV